MAFGVEAIGATGLDTASRGQAVKTGMTFVAHESRATLAEHLRAVRGKTILLPEDEGASANAFYSLSVTAPAEAPVEIGVPAVGHGLKPSACLIAGGQVLLVGYDCFVAGIDLHAAQIHFHMNLWAPFYEFMEGASDDTAIVVHEVGVTMIDAQGRQCWSVATDIIGKRTLDGAGGLYLEMALEPRHARVDIVTGTIAWHKSR